ncbi:MAG: carboxylating nicotinate-nucleotide diphosphorylase [Thermovibrio sp.]|nr:MAG: carboxylating nicotinate-nucleotide diphosphorylase [Thermovibrio sp.]
MNELYVRNLILNFLNEDLGYLGDITTSSLSDTSGRACLIAREGGIFCGAPFFEMVYRVLSEEVSFKWYIEEGKPFKKGDVICEMVGNLKVILTGERTSLNIVQRLSGIATETRRYVDGLNGSKIKLLDTRKTTPGLRVLEKYATKIGGALNHRFGLYDAVMVKDNHIKAFGSIERAVREIVRNIPVTSKIEVEVESMEQIEDLLKVIEYVDVVMLDNWRDDDVEKGIKRIKEKKEEVKIELSGGITIDRLPKIRNLPIDFISTSKIVTAARWIDLSLEVEWT